MSIAANLAAIAALEHLGTPWNTTRCSSSPDAKPKQPRGFEGSGTPGTPGTPQKASTPEQHPPNLTALIEGWRYSFIERVAICIHSGGLTDCEAVEIATLQIGREVVEALSLHMQPTHQTNHDDAPGCLVPRSTPSKRIAA